jgi:hypothetical protein
MIFTKRIKRKNMNKTKQTQDLVIIEKWIKERKGVPAIVKNTDDLLRIKFDSLDADLVEITWAEFFALFKENKLTFMYEVDGASRFCKFIYSENK